MNKEETLTLTSRDVVIGSKNLNPRETYDLAYGLYEQANYKLEKCKKKAQLIYDIGFDYDGYNTPENLKKIIDELVSYSDDILKITGGDNKG